MLCEQGSVAALAAQIGEQAASEALYSLSQQVPEEIRSSWPLVIAYGRFQMQYERANLMGDVRQALDAAKAQAQLLKDVY